MGAQVEAVAAVKEWRSPASPRAKLAQLAAPGPDLPCKPVALHMTLRQTAADRSDDRGYSRKTRTKSRQPRRIRTISLAALNRRYYRHRHRTCQDCRGVSSFLNVILRCVLYGTACTQNILSCILKRPCFVVYRYMYTRHWDRRQGCYIHDTRPCSNTVRYTTQLYM